MRDLHALAVDQPAGQGERLQVRIGERATGRLDEVDDARTVGQPVHAGPSDGAGDLHHDLDRDDGRWRGQRDGAGHRQVRSTGRGDGRTSHQPATTTSATMPAATATRAGSTTVRRRDRRSSSDRGGSGRSSSGIGIPPVVRRGAPGGDEGAVAPDEAGAWHPRRGARSARTKRGAPSARSPPGGQSRTLHRRCYREAQTVVRSGEVGSRTSVARARRATQSASISKGMRR